MCCCTTPLGKGDRAPRCIPPFAALRQRRDCPPRHPDEGLAPSTRLPCPVCMSTPSDIAGFDEASSASHTAGPGNLASSATAGVASGQAVGMRRRRGRHHGPRPVPDPRSAWLTTRTTPRFLRRCERMRGPQICRCQITCISRLGPAKSAGAARPDRGDETAGADPRSDGQARQQSEPGGAGA